jgi:hypothetical protein
MAGFYLPHLSVNVFVFVEQEKKDQTVNATGNADQDTGVFLQQRVMPYRISDRGKTRFYCCPRSWILRAVTI